MRYLLGCLVITCVIFFSRSAHAGLYYSGEKFAELPSQWRGFLLDQRALRQIAVTPVRGMPAGSLRIRYQAAADTLRAESKKRSLTAGEQADLGALYIRLGEIEKALAKLRPAVQQFPNEFHLAANLGTAWQLQGDLAQAALALEKAVGLAPQGLRRAEEFHLKLVRLRQRQARNSASLDDLFGVRYDQESAASLRTKLPDDAAALTQRLALWFPDDGRLLWQLAELASLHGDWQTAAAIMDGCVNEFRMSDPLLHRRRQAARAATESQASTSKLDVQSAKSLHQGHVSGLRPRSQRPLLVAHDMNDYPPVRSVGVNSVPWSVFAETSIDRQFRPTFCKYLQELNGKEVALTGYMQPIGEDGDLSRFLLVENPVGCWYCEMPDITGIILVEMPADASAEYARGAIKVTGTLRLNDRDPENFVYIISKANVADAD
jgi:hypothetical protein